MPITKRLLYPLTACLVAAVVTIAIWTGERQQLFKQSRSSLYTIVSISAVADSREHAESAIDAAYAELDRLGRLLNFYADNSELSAINRNAGRKPVTVSPETLEIIKLAVYAGRQTEGGFDVTLGPVIRLWDFKEKSMPTEEQVTEQLPFVGFGNIVIDEAASTVFLKKAGVEIDLGGIIKGYAADKAVEVLKQKGIGAGIVAVAGDIKTFGRQVDGRPWRLGVQNPRQQGNDDALLATLELEDKGISTSGDYQRFFMVDGLRYHHLLNPTTGFPESRCQSVTVIADQAALTDALATGIFIMGPEKGIETLEKLGMNGIIVDRSGKVLLTKGIQNNVNILRQ